MIRSFRGKAPKIHPKAYVSETAYLLGDVEVQANASIWPGCVIRADNGRIIIGENTCVQDNSTIHADRDARIGPNVAIGHQVLCHADSVEENVLIGSGAIINGGRIGRFSLIASGTVLLEETLIPPYSLVMGVPGKVKGQVEKRHIELVKSIVDTYVRKASEMRIENHNSTG